MAYSRTFVISLGSSMTGLTLRATLKDTAGTTVGGIVTTGFVERGGGTYIFTHTAIPDDHQGCVDFANNSTAAYLASASINPPDTVSLDAADIRDAVGLANASLDDQLADIATGVTTAGAAAQTAATASAAVKVVTDKLATMLVLDGAVYQFTVNALELGPAGGSGGGGGATAEAIWDEIIDGTNRARDVLAYAGAMAAGDIDYAHQAGDLWATTVRSAGVSGEIRILGTINQATRERIITSVVAPS